jgi:predicted transcriptional regulator
MPEDSGKKPMTIRLSAEAQRLLDLLAQDNGVSKTAVIELAIREMARRQQVGQKGDD